VSITNDFERQTHPRKSVVSYFKTNRRMKLEVMKMDGLT